MKHHYVLVVQNIAANHCETEIIDFIIDRYDNANVNTLMFLGVTTLAKLMNFIIRYRDRNINWGAAVTDDKNTFNFGQFAAHNVIKPTTNYLMKPAVNNYVKTAANVKLMKPNSEKIDVIAEGIRRYNFSITGYYQSDCPYEIRSNESCFKCWKDVHSD